MKYNFETIKTKLDKGVLFATVSNPPCNVMSVQMMLDLTKLGEQTAVDDDVRVIVLQSADPEFFIVHFDANVVLKKPISGLPKRPLEFPPLTKMVVVFRDNPKASLVKIAGFAGGGGSEIASSCDMRFGVRGKAIFNQMEVPIGIIPGASGSQNWPRLVGRGRALEVILGADNIDAETAEKWGFLNRSFETVEEMNSFVDALAYRIAKWPPHAVAIAKESIGYMDPHWRNNLMEETHITQFGFQYPITKRLVRKLLEHGAQTRDGEKRINEICVEIADEVATEDKNLS
jgi:enoyl-CoA hydratase/carnithine racemase